MSATRASATENTRFPWAMRAPKSESAATSLLMCSGWKSLETPAKLTTSVSVMVRASSTVNVSPSSISS